MTEKKSEELWKLPLYKIYTDDDDVNVSIPLENHEKQFCYAD